jgi:hypothetical protein
MHFRQEVGNPLDLINYDELFFPFELFPQQGGAGSIIEKKRSVFNKSMRIGLPSRLRRNVLFPTRLGPRRIQFFKELRASLLFITITPFYHDKMEYQVK